MKARNRTFAGLGLLLVLLAGQASAAADPHSYIPGDAKVIIQARVRQLLDAPLGDRDKGVTWRGLLVKEFQNPGILGVKPLDDIRLALVALPSVGEVRKVFMVLEGKFDAPAIRARIARDFKDSFKEQGEGPTAIWQFRIPARKLAAVTTPEDVYAAIPDPALCLISLGSKDDLEAALAAKSPGTPRDLRALLERGDKDEVVSWALLSHLGGPYAEVKEVKRAFGLFQNIQGGVKVDEEVVSKLTATAADPEAAKEASDVFRAGFNGLMGIVALLSRRDRNLVPTLDFLRSVKVSARDNLIVVRGKLDRDALDQLINNKKK